MYTLNKKERLKRGIRIYLGIAAFCLLFGSIYEYFSHGVYSGYMMFLFLFPLLGGVLPAFLLLFTDLPFPGRFALNCYNSGLAAWTVGSCMSGVFEIYGSTCELLNVYWIAGAFLMGIGLISYPVSRLKN